MLEWEDGWGQNGGHVGTFLIKDGILPPIECDHHAFTPLHGNFSRAHTYKYLYLLNIYIFVCFLLVACSNGKMDGAALNGHTVVYGVCYQNRPRPQPKCRRNSIRLGAGNGISAGWGPHPGQYLGLEGQYLGPSLVQHDFF